MAELFGKYGSRNSTVFSLTPGLSQRERNERTYEKISASVLKMELN